MRTPVRRVGVEALLACVIVVAVLATSGQALAQQRARKPHKLWQQYPLKVQDSGQGHGQPKPVPSQSPASASPESSTDASPQVSTHRAVPDSRQSTSGGKFLLLGGGVVLLAALFFALKRANPNSADDRPSEHAPIPARAQVAEPGDDDAAHGSPNGHQELLAQPAVDPGGQRVRVQLEDGRSLEGYVRESNSTNGELVILNVVAAFDAKGNDEARRPSDSFILRSEIASMQRLDDP